MHSKSATKDQQRLRNCHRLQEAEEAWPLSAVWFPRLNPRRGTRHSWKNWGNLNRVWSLAKHTELTLLSQSGPMCQGVCNVCVSGDVGWWVCGNSLYCLCNSSVNLKFLKKKSFKKLHAVWNKRERKSPCFTKIFRKNMTGRNSQLVLRPSNLQHCIHVDDHLWVQNFKNKKSNPSRF